MERAHEAVVTADFRIAVVAEGDLLDLLPLMRAYCDFYETSPSDGDLLGLSRALIANPDREGVQLLARARDDDAAGFATIFWTWSTTNARRIGVMNDLFVSPPARGSGLADALIEACRRRCAAHGAGALEWVTAHDNRRAQGVYDRVGGRRDDRWVHYELPVG